MHLGAGVGRQIQADDLHLTTGGHQQPVQQTLDGATPAQVDDDNRVRLTELGVEVAQVAFTQAARGRHDLAAEPLVVAQRLEGLLAQARDVQTPAGERREPGHLLHAHPELAQQLPDAGGVPPRQEAAQLLGAALEDVGQRAHLPGGPQRGRLDPAVVPGLLQHAGEEHPLAHEAVDPVDPVGRGPFGGPLAESGEHRAEHGRAGLPVASQTRWDRGRVGPVQGPGPHRGHPVVAVHRVDGSVGGGSGPQPFQVQRRLQPTGVLGVVDGEDPMLAGAFDVGNRIVTEVDDPGRRHTGCGEHVGEQAVALVHPGVAGGEHLGEPDVGKLRPAQQPAQLVRGEVGVGDQVDGPAELGDGQFGQFGHGQVRPADVPLEGDLHGDEIINGAAVRQRRREHRPDLVQASLRRAAPGLAALACPGLGMHPELGELRGRHRRRQQSGRGQPMPEQQKGVGGLGNEPQQQRVEHVQSQHLGPPGLQLGPDLTDPDVGEHGRPPQAASAATSDGPAGIRVKLDGDRPELNERPRYYESALQLQSPEYPSPVTGVPKPAPCRPDAVCSGPCDQVFSVASDPFPTRHSSRKVVGVEPD